MKRFVNHNLWINLRAIVEVGALVAPASERDISLSGAGRDANLADCAICFDGRDESIGRGP